MRPTVAVAIAVLTALCGGAHESTAQPVSDIRYTARYARAGDTAIAIEMTWTPPLATARALVMPRAIPMGYGEQRYDAFLREVTAHDAAGVAHAATREEGPRWRLEAGTTRVTYRVDLAALERTIKAASDQSRVRDGYLGALGYSLFAFLDGAEARPARLRVEAPADWPVFVTLAPRFPFTPGPVDATATDYYALADAQIIMGPKAEVRRLATSPVPVYLASYAEGPVDLDRVGRLALTAFERVAAWFGSTPFDHYTLHQELLTPLSPEHEYGMSMEHLGSSTYYLAASAGITAASTAADDARVLYNYAHHISHAWVPKRAYGQGYFPFQWELAPVLDSIWFAEGFGQYAAILAVAAGTPDPAAFRADMLERRFRTNVTNAPDFLKRLSLVELSRVASTRYAEDFRTGRLVFSRGGLMAAAIDDHIQRQTSGAKSLRDALRYLVAWTAKEQRAFTIEELPALIQTATGVNTRAVIEEWLKPLP
jgi:predicted metalloprotease with PDZ domain